ncbi:MAG: hypothetical protein WA790_20665 [Sulfitobacter sp.]
MNVIYGRKPDFEAEITVLTADQGGRKTPPFNKIRWDFRYADDAPSDGIYMIHPYFLDKNRELFPDGQALSGTMTALMFIVIEEMADYHRKRIAIGTEFYCVEGYKICATGTVTDLIGLRC